MTLHLTEPKIIERGPYNLVGCYAICEGDEEPWGEATEGLVRRLGEIRNRVGDTHRPPVGSIVLCSRSMTDIIIRRRLTRLQKWYSFWGAPQSVVNPRKVS